MSYIDITQISNIYATDIQNRDSSGIVDKSLARTDRDINIVCLGVGVTSDNIPVTSAGVTTSDVLINYGECRYLVHLFDSVMNATNIDDTYEEQIKYYTAKADAYKKTITYETITGNKEILIANRIRTVPMW